MLKQKAIILSLMLTAVLVLAGSVSAEDEQTIIDAEDDVIVFDENSDMDFNEIDIILGGDNLPTTDDHPDIDITQVSYSKELGGTTATVQMNINSDGSISDSLTTMYQISITTSDDIYDISYWDGNCTLNGEDITHTNTGSSLTANFDLGSSDENYVYTMAMASTYSLTSSSIYIDIATDTEVVDVSISGPSSGETDENLTFTGSVQQGSASDYNWEWSFGDEDGGTRSGQNPTYSYDSAGDYEIELLVYDDNNTKLGVAYYDVSITESDSNGGSDNGENGDDTPPGNGDPNDKDDEADSEGLLMFIGLVAVIIIAGVAVLVYIMKK